MHGFTLVLLHVLGIDDTTSNWYGFWSGFGSDLSEFAVLGTIFTMYRRHKCKACWRVAAHPVEHTPYKTCHKHLTPTVHDQIQRHHAAKHPEQSKLLKGI